MSKYEVGITDINVLVRRLGYVSAILQLLGHNTLSESVLYTRLEKWSLDHKQGLIDYTNQQGAINATREQTGPKRYTNFAASLGLVGRIAGACRVTRFGKTLLPFLCQVPDRNPFELICAERCAYLYWLLVKDSDQFLTIIRILAEEPPESLSDLQNIFPTFYLQQLQSHMLIAEEHVARDILAVRNRVAHWRKASSRSIENIVPPRVHWLIDLGFVSTENCKGWTHRVAKHVSTQSRRENAASVDRWQSDDSCRFLVCDGSAEEGINLQVADMVFHLDLPWDVFRLEQRLGRVDRYFRGKSKPVESRVFVYGEQTYAEGWFLFAADSCGVFDRSVSSLQYVLADLESEVIVKVIAGGAGVFDSDIELRREHLQFEADRIAAHDSLDSVSGLHRGLNERLLQEEETLRIGAALKRWLTGVGAKVRSPARGSFQIVSRSRLQVPFALELAMAPWVDSESGSMSRQAAVERSVPLVRPGHGLLDEIVRHLR